MKNTEKNTRAIKANTIVMVIGLVISLREQVTLPVSQSIEVNNLTVNMNIIDNNENK